MSVVDDTPKLLQNLITPDLQALKAELKSVDRESRLREEALSAKIWDMDEKSKLGDEALVAKINSRFDLVSAKIDVLAGALNLHSLVQAVERKLASPHLLSAG